ncbi:hypothetical protein CPU12_07800 [Malaciobacter molluscorum LMG 25693]|uniref:DUF4153 domain-containing membrane protein n=1 Tax=Malaciobacter molluscorum LMG 25693 TaxID=870501 RepID=A0A2G1DHM6_9BACT|nr:DUF4153 domain-containing protein [Malaciobacter molluscorum]AXX93337.1 DUF4153 domain-containing membrane protein [Malaciobacter molluscorum LMG 25693]PHO17991.1 hypothetical protein CPU12_07800 [Malaciobacter molluscorum LMG 25693]
MTFYKRIKEQFTKEVFSRFPATFIFMPLAIISTFANKYYNYLDLSKFFIYAMIISITIHLFIYKKNISIPFKIIIWVLGFITIFLSNYFHDTQYFYWLSLLLFLSFSSFLMKKTSNIEILNFNLFCLYAISFAFFSSVILYIGVLSIYSTVKYLFDIKILTDNILKDIATITFLGLFPILFLNKIIKSDFDYKEKINEHFYSVILKYILSPLVFVYTIILYIYFAKITILQELPKGNLALIICIFFTIVILVKSLLTGLAKHNKLTNFILRFSTYFSIIPIIFLSISIYTRVSQYGITSSRYVLIACAIWFIYLLIYELIYKQFNIKNALISLFIITLFSGLTPFNAHYISVYSQADRLKNIFIKNDMYINSKVIPAKKELPGKQRIEITSIINYLENSIKGREELKKLLKIEINTNFYNNVFKHLNIEYTTKYTIKQRKYLTGFKLNDIAINSKNYNYSFSIFFSDSMKKAYYGNKYFTYWLEKYSILNLKIENKLFQLDLRHILEKLKKEKIKVIDKTNYKKMVFKIKHKNLIIKLFIKDIYFSNKDNKIEIYSANGLLLFNIENRK